MGEKSIELKKVMDLNNVVEYLEALAQGLRAGKVVVEKAGKYLSLNPPSVLEVEIEAKQKKEKAKFTLELSWKSGELQEVEESIKISSIEPAAAPSEAEEGAAGQTTE